MVEVDEYEILDNLYYTEEHEWARVEGDKVTIGITDFAQKELTDIVYLEFPEVGKEVSFMEEWGIVESVKAMSGIYAPVSGTITEVNTELPEAPELVNEDPYGKGWMIVITPTNLEEDLGKILNAEKYAEHIKQILKEREVET